MKSVPDEKPDRAAGFVSSFPVADIGGIQGAYVTRTRYGPKGKYRKGVEHFHAIFIPIGAT